MRSSFDWVNFFHQYHIEYVDKGKNVSAGNVNVRCPFCGYDDPSQHMSVGLRGQGWCCYRHRAHSGKSAARLVAALLHCSIDRARNIVGDDQSFIPTDFLSQVQRNINGVEALPMRRLGLPTEFKDLSSNLPSSWPYVRYLLGPDRKFTKAEVRLFTSDYGVYYATRGPYRWRVVFTVYQDKKLQSWVGRTIVSDGSVPRYRALTTDPDKAKAEGLDPALGPITNYFLWYDRLKKGGDWLVLVEGPFDALKLSVLGGQYGIMSTCFFTASPSDMQVDLLHELIPKFERTTLLLDAGTFTTALEVKARMVSLGVDILQLPHDIKDPGVLTPRQFRDFLLDKL